MNKILYIYIFLFLQPVTAQFFNAQKDKIDIKKYQFFIKINDENNRIEAQAVILFKALQSVKQIDLNLKNIDQKGKGMQVASVTNQDGKSLYFKHINDSLHIQTPLVSDTLIHIRYSGIPADGLYIKTNRFGKRTFFGDNWPNRAQYWLPVIDHLSDKALVEWIITAPSHYEIVANGRLISKIRRTDNFTVFRYQTSVPIAPKIMVFAAADFNIKNEPPVYLHDKCIPVSNWIFQNNTPKAFDDFKESPSILKFYDSLIGAYSYNKMANVQSNTRFGGMENAGNIFYDEYKVNGKHQIENLVAHETAHQWFGNSVSEKNWRDIWLSEGFATYLTDLYIEHKYGVEKFKERMAMERQKIINYQQKNPNPVVYNEKNDLFRLLNINSYEKGAWVLHQLRYLIGDKDFFKLLKTYYQKYRQKNAGTEDFIHLAEEISGKNLHNFFQQYLYRNDIPAMQIHSQVSNNKLQITVQQITGKPFQIKLPVVINYRKKSKKLILTISKRQEKFVFDMPGIDNNYLVQIDPNIQVLFQLLK